MKGQRLAGHQGRGIGPHQGEPVTAHVLATNDSMGIADFGDTGGAKGSIMLPAGGQRGSRPPLGRP